MIKFWWSWGVPTPAPPPANYARASRYRFSQRVHEVTNLSMFAIIMRLFYGR